MPRNIPYGKQEISDNDIDEVIKVLKSDFITQGPKIDVFESNISNYVGSKYSCAVNSATSALHISCLALGVGAGDYVWTSPNSFVASSNCALYCGANIDFVDIDPITNNISLDCLERKLKEAEKKDALPKVVIPVHLSGLSCDMKSIYDLSNQYKFKIIEDASHAIGAEYKNKKVGSCEYSDISVFSFHPVKIITTGEGGLACTNNKNIAKKLNILRSHGVTRDRDFMENEPHGDWYYEQLDLGLNYRITDIQAALGISQLKRLDQFIQKRNKLAKIYDAELNSEFYDLPQVGGDQVSSFHLYIIKLKEELKSNHRKLFSHLRSNGIGVNIHYIPIHYHPYYKKLGFRKGDFPNAENYYQRAISIPLYFGLSKSDQKYVIDEMNRFFE